MLGNRTLCSPGRYSLNTSFKHLLLSAVSTRGQLDECMKWNIEPWGFLLILLHEVGIDASENRLVGKYQNVLRSLKLHDDRLKANNDITITVNLSQSYKRVDQSLTTHH